ncbi:MAG: TlpA disulfide reductase family protein [Mariprofundaceae bacterium]|nr:TlpA disulfide reductase family protein [Mariprofundaceae bacterium]
MKHLLERRPPGLPIMLLLAMLVFSLPGHAAAESFRWMDDTGQLHSLKEFEGKPVIVHIWASWCPPCRAEMPELSSWLREHPETSFLVVSVDESAKAASVFLAQHHITAPLLLTDSQEASKLGVRVLPSTFVISGDGEVTRRLLGSQNWADQGFTRSLLEESRKETPEKDQAAGHFP